MAPNGRFGFCFQVGLDSLNECWALHAEPGRLGGRLGGLSAESAMETVMVDAPLS